MKDKKGEHPFGDTGQLIAFGVFLVVWIGDSFFLRKSTFLAEHVPLYIRLAVLFIALAEAVLLFRSGRVAVRHEQRPNDVIKSGAFRYVRHPLYLASLLTLFGLTVSTLSLFSLAVLAGIFVFYDFIAGFEERVMVEKFGETYENYRMKTGKWAPRPGRRP